MSDFYHNQLKDKFFTRSGSSSLWTSHGLRYSSETSLKQLMSLELGESTRINNKLITRAK